MAGEDLSFLPQVWESQVIPSLRDDQARTEESEVPRPSRAEVLHYLLDKTGAIRERYRAGDSSDRPATDKVLTAPQATSGAAQSFAVAPGVNCGVRVVFAPAGLQSPSHQRPTTE